MCNSLTLIPRRYYIDTSKTKFRQIYAYFFNVISLIEKFDVTSMVQKSTSFPRTFFGVISMVEKSTLFPHTFFDLISLVEISTLFSLTFFDVILMVEKSTLFAHTSLEKNLDEQKFDFAFGFSCKLMKTFGEVFLC